jgi:flavin-dependent dehydrogenase
MLAVPRIALDDIIRERAIASGSKFSGGVRVTGIETLEDGVKVSGVSGKGTYSANGRVAIIATGASQKLLFDLGILRHRPNMILAARAYFQDIRELSGRFEFHFDGVPLPGYGWVFPVAETSANIGAGILAASNGKGGHANNAGAVLARFLRIPLMREMLSNATQVGPVKGYPLRTDFASAPTYAERILLVGEAAGLVNPLTGEGVDLALESGKLAAGHLIGMFAAADFSTSRLSHYDTLLRARFQRLFVFSDRIRRWYLNEPVLNRLIDMANRRDRLRALFTDIVLGNADPAQGLSLRTVLQIALGR